MDYIEKRKRSLISLTYFAVFAVAYVLFIKYAFWIVAPFIIAFVIAMLLQRPIGFLSRKTHITKKLWSVILVLLLVVVIVGLLSLIIYIAGTEFYDFGKSLVSKVDKLPTLLESLETRILTFTGRLPGSIGSTVRDAVNGIFDKVISLVKESEAETAETAAQTSAFSFSSISAPISSILSTAKRIPAIFTAVLIAIVACFFMTSDYDGFTGMIKENITAEHTKMLSKTKHVIIDVLGKWCKSYAILLFITFCEMSIGLYILKLANVYTGGYIFAIAILTAIVDILPVFGTGTVIIPWAIISLFTHKISMFVGLIIIYAVITVLRQILEPRLVSANVDMHPVITLMSMYIGIQVFGVLGIIILPLSVIIIKTLNDEGIIHLWGQDKLPGVSSDGKKKKSKKKDNTSQSEPIAVAVTENVEVPEQAEEQK